MPLLARLRALLTGKAYSVPTAQGGWYPMVREGFGGAWQRNIEINRDLASSFHADFACKTLIARDIAKLPLLLKAKDKNGIWTEVNNPAFSPVLRKPNRFQTRNQFWEHWILSKLSRGNTYVLKVRDNRRIVVALYVLDPRRVTPLVANDGSVFYQLDNDELNGVPAGVTVPHTEIIHDRMNCGHPLIGVPPIFASGLAAMQGLNIQRQSLQLFENNAQPGGILSAPGHIEDDTAARLKADWEARFSGPNIGRIAVLGDGLKFEKMSLTAVEGQLIEQLKWTAEVVCSTYHVPPYKIGVGALPSYNNVQSLNVEYYTQCLQSLIEDAESVLDDGLGLGEQYDLGVEFDIDNLLRMDTASQADAVTKLVGGSLLTPNEGRLKFNAPPLEGGDTVYMQQQNFSLAALAKRDAQDDPFKTAPAPAPEPKPDDEADPDIEDDAELADETQRAMRKSLGLTTLAA
jgi:HK97 family phage portal protein